MAAMSESSPREAPMPPKGVDVENLEDDDFSYGTSVGTSSAAVRLGFLRKVYGLLTVQLMVTVFVSTLFMGIPALRHFAVNQQWFFLVTGIATIFVLIGLAAVRNQAPLNMQLLGVFTVMESLCIANVCAIYQEAGYGYIIFQAAVATAVIFGGLTAYCFISKQDFSFLGGFLFCGLIGLIVIGLLQGLMSLIFGMRMDAMNFLVSVFGVLLFSGYILYDTSLLIHKFSADEYIFATVNLYLDILNLFLYIVRILSAGNRD